MKFSNVNEDKWIILENGAKIHKTAIIYSNVDIGENCIIGEYAIVGRNNINLEVSGSLREPPINTVIGNNTIIDAHSYVSQGVVLGSYVILARNTFVGRYTKIGDYTKCHYNTQIYENVNIGTNCKIGGFCCNNSIVGDYSNIYGTLGHKFKIRNNPNKKAPVIGNHVTVGLGSVILEDVIIGDGAYVAANAVITKSINSGQKVRNINECF